MYPSVPGRPHTLVLGVSAWLVLGRCLSRQVPGIIAITIGTCREQAVRSREGLHLSVEAVEEPAWFLWFGVEVRELDDSVYAVP